MHAAHLTTKHRAVSRPFDSLSPGYRLWRDCRRVAGGARLRSLRNPSLSRRGHPDDRGVPGFDGVGSPPIAPRGSPGFEVGAFYSPPPFSVCRVPCLEEEHDEGLTVGLMKARGLGPVVACMLLHVAAANAGTLDHADGVVRAKQRDVIQATGGSLTVTVDRSPLSIVLDLIARQSGVSIRCDAPIAETVTTNLRDVTLDEGLTRILGPRSAVFVYSSNPASGRRPRLVEVRVYADHSGPPGVASADRHRPAESGENVADTGGADGALARSSTNPEAYRALSQAPDPSARASAAISLGRTGGDEAIIYPAMSIATDP